MSITVITGPMKSGKSLELIQRALSHAYDGKLVLAVKPDKDTRDEHIKSRAGLELMCRKIPVTQQGVHELIKFIGENEPDVLVIDEFQFFSSYEFIDLLQETSDNGIEIIVSGLALDSDRNPFGLMPQLLAISDDVIKLSAPCECKNCVRKGIYTFADFEKGEDNVESEVNVYLTLCQEHFTQKTKEKGRPLYWRHQSARV